MHECPFANTYMYVWCYASPQCDRYWYHWTEWYFQKEANQLGGGGGDEQNGQQKQLQHADQAICISHAEIQFCQVKQRWMQLYKAHKTWLQYAAAILKSQLPVGHILPRCFCSSSWSRHRGCDIEGFLYINRYNRSCTQHRDTPVKGWQDDPWLDLIAVAW